MEKWEYMIVDSRKAEGGSFFEGKSANDIQKYLNALGSEGWNIVSLSFKESLDNIAFFGVAKREIKE